MRAPPKVDAPADFTIPKQRKGYTTQVREYELITPLFGGGVTPAEADPVTVVRATEIRGQLRFWWRACRGGKYSTVQEMKKDEDDIWGAAATEKSGGPSQVQVEVKSLSEGNTFQVEWEEKRRGQKVKVPSTDVGNPKSPYSYVAFPLNDKKGTVRENIRFQVRITFPKTYSIDVEAALWAWETFGGIGARTRRGFGALRLLTIGGNQYTDLPSSNRVDVEKWLLQKFKDFVDPGTFPNDVPHLQHRPLFFVTRSSQNALDAWKRLFGRLKNFRQKRTDKNTGRSSEYGHSDWPEANAIRRLLENHPKGPHASQNINKFPRGAFGLPLIYHLEHDLGKPNITLQGKDKDKERLASPLILRPLACSDRKYVGVALILAGSRLPENLTLKGEGIPDGIVPDTQLTAQEAQRIPLLNGNPDVLQAFLDILKEKE